MSSRGGEEPPPSAMAETPRALKNQNPSKDDQQFSQEGTSHLDLTEFVAHAENQRAKPIQSTQNLQSTISKENLLGAKYAFPRKTKPWLCCRTTKS